MYVAASDDLTYLELCSQQPLVLIDSFRESLSPCSCSQGLPGTLPPPYMLLPICELPVVVLCLRRCRVGGADAVDAVQVGVADSSTYGEFAPPSWDAPAEYQEKCYFGNMEVHP